METKIGIILLHYGDIHVTDACIASVFASDFKNFELLVVDNHSNIPFSKSSFSKSKKIKSIVEKSNSGYAGGMNSGIKYYFGRTVTHFLFLNNDIVFEKNSLARMVECSIKNPSSIISPVMYKANPENLSEFGGALSPFKMFFHPLSSKPAENQKVSYVSGACLLINRNLISRIGLLDERFFMYSEDMDFCIRANSLSIPLIVCTKSKMLHKMGSASGGVGPFAVYYIHRNRILLAKKYHRGQKYVSFVIYYTITIILKLFVWFFKKKELCKWFWLGYIDGLSGKKGRSPRKF